MGNRLSATDSESEEIRFRSQLTALQSGVALKKDDSGAQSNDINDLMELSADSLHLSLRSDDFKREGQSALSDTLGLSLVAKKLEQVGTKISVVAVGGAVNTIYLKNRATTSDVDLFYYTKKDRKEIRALIRMAREVVGDSPDLLEEDWLNNHTAAFIEEPLIKKLYEEARQQNVINFDRNGLTVYAAPWRYALLAKMDRLGTISKAKEYDLGDAVAYLHEIVHGASPVAQDRLEFWAGEFGINRPKEGVIELVAARYRECYDDSGILLITDGWCDLRLR